MAFFVNFSLGGSATAGEPPSPSFGVPGTPAATVVVPSPFPVVGSLINYFLGKQEHRNSDITRISESNLFPAFMRSLDISPDALGHDFLQVFHVFRAGLVKDFGAFARNVSRKEGLALEYPVQ